MKKHNKNGFTLVELLAVIVILAIIMVIAIPSVITIMDSAKAKSFSEYTSKVVTAAETKYLYDTSNGDIYDYGCYLYDITKSLDLENTGDYKGYILIDASQDEKLYYYVSMYNTDFELLNFNYTKDYKKVLEYVESNEDTDKIDKDKIIYELSKISSNCTSVSYNFNNHGYNDTFEYDHDIDDSSPVETKASYLKKGLEVNSLLINLSGNKEFACNMDDEEQAENCATYKDESITSIAKSTATPPAGAIIISTEESKYPTYAWVEGSTIYYKSDSTIYMNDDSTGLFSYFPNATSIDLSGFNTSKVTNMSYMFYEDTSVANLDVSNFDTSNVTSILFMFSGCASLTNLDLSNFNTKSLSNMGAAFASMSKLKSINLSSFDTSKVTDMTSTFTGVSELQELDLSSFNTSSVKSMVAMFSGASKLEKLNISNFNTSSVTSMGSMFSGCKKLDTIIGFEKITTENVTSMTSMFSSFQSDLENGHLDLSGFNTSKVTNMSGMFSSAFSNSKTLSLNLGEHFDTSNVTNMNSMFNMFAYKVPTFTLDLGPNFDTSNVTSMQYMFQSVGREANGVSANIIFGDKFKFKKGVYTSRMFYCFLYGFPNVEVYFPYMEFNNIGVHNNNMFYNWPSNGKIYVENTSDKTWLKGKYSQYFKDTNVIIK